VTYGGFASLSSDILHTCTYTCFLPYGDHNSDNGLIPTPDLVRTSPVPDDIITASRRISRTLHRYVFSALALSQQWTFSPNEGHFLCRT